MRKGKSNESTSFLPRKGFLSPSKSALDKIVGQESDFSFDLDGALLNQR